MVRTYKNWSERDEHRLIELYNQGCTNKEIQEQLNRNKNSVAHRVQLLKKMELIGTKRRTKTNKENYYSDYVNKIKRFKERELPSKIQSGSTKDLSEKNYQLILDMDLTNEADLLAPSTRYNYIRYLQELALSCKKNLDEIGLKEILSFLVERNKELKSTQPYKSCFKEFYNKFLEQNYQQLNEQTPKQLNLQKIVNFLNKKQRKRGQEDTEIEKDHLTRIEMVKLVSSIRGNDPIAIRNRALISALYDTGARISELLATLFENLKIGGKVPKIYFPISKTKPRYSHMLKFSLPYLMDWLKIHEFGDDPNAPFFYSLSTSNYGEHLTSSAVGQILKRALKISKINKKISLHSLRHSKAFHCAEDGMLVSEANMLFGWSRTSNMFNYYASIGRKELELKELERANKLTPEQLQFRKQERNAFVLKTCPRCNLEKIAQHYRFCPQCSLALDPKVARELEMVTESAGKITKEMLMNQITNEMLDEVTQNIKKKLKIKD